MWYSGTVNLNQIDDIAYSIITTSNAHKTIGSNIEKQPNQPIWNNLVRCAYCDERPKSHLFLQEQLDQMSSNERVEYLNEGYCLIGKDTLATADQFSNIATDLNGFPIVDFSGPGTSDTMDEDSELDQYDYESVTDLDLAVERYMDKYPNEYTAAISPNGQFLPGIKPNFDLDQKSLFVEGEPGFITVNVYDDHLTRLHHAKLLNVFKDQQGRLAIGGIRIRQNSDRSITAHCVRNECQAQLTVSLELAESEGLNLREVMENFILDVIRHGNNHAANWFTTRNTFYEIQPSPRTSNSELTDEESIQFLMDHAKLCKTESCKHDDWIAAYATNSVKTTTLKETA